MGKSAKKKKKKRFYITLNLKPSYIIELSYFESFPIELEITSFKSVK